MVRTYKNLIIAAAGENFEKRAYKMHLGALKIVLNWMEGQMEGNFCIEKCPPIGGQATLGRAYWRALEGALQLEGSLGTMVISSPQSHF